MGIFITVEGIEGSGKSSLINSLADHYRDLNLRVLTTKEPGGTALGAKIRELVLQRDCSAPEIVPIAELLLFAADRAQHCRTVLRPGLKSEQLVICDRFTYSTLAYQGYGSGLPIESLRQINRIATEDLEPDLVLLLDIDPVLSLERAKSRALKNAKAHVVGADSTDEIDMESLDKLPMASDDWNHFEKQALAFHHRVRLGFLELARAEDDKLGRSRFCTINAESPAEDVFNNACKAVDAILLARD